MGKMNGQRILQIVVLIISVGLIAWAAPEMMQRLGWNFGADNDHSADVIVQGRDLMDVSSRVIRQGGLVTRTLPQSNAVVTRLNVRQIRALLNADGVCRIYQSRPQVNLHIAQAHTIPNDG